MSESRAGIETSHVSVYRRAARVLLLCLLILGIVLAWVWVRCDRECRLLKEELVASRNDFAELQDRWKRASYQIGAIETLTGGASLRIEPTEKPGCMAIEVRGELVDGLPVFLRRHYLQLDPSATEVTVDVRSADRVDESLLAVLHSVLLCCRSAKVVVLGAGADLSASVRGLSGHEAGRIELQ